MGIMFDSIHQIILLHFISLNRIRAVFWKNLGGIEI